MHCSFGAATSRAAEGDAPLALLIEIEIEIEIGIGIGIEKGIVVGVLDDCFDFDFDSDSDFDGHQLVALRKHLSMDLDIGPKRPRH